MLFGYLRIRQSSPRNSVLLLDEPELHLNPRLVRGLPSFYHEHLGAVANNQVWLVTHSDALLREAVGTPEFSVLHMQASTGEDNQVRPLSLEDEVEQAVVALTGDLAAHKPDGKVVIFEGAGSEFDLFMTKSLFPGFDDSTNMISGGDKLAVRRLHEALAAAADKADHRAWHDKDPSALLAWAKSIGPMTETLMERILTEHSATQGYRFGLGLRRVGTKYGPECTEAACKKALTFGVASFRPVERILQLGREAETQDNPKPRRIEHENVRGSYSPRRSKSSATGTASPRSWVRDRTSSSITSRMGRSRMS